MAAKPLKKVGDKIGSRKSQTILTGPVVRKVQQRSHRVKSSLYKQLQLSLEVQQHHAVKTQELEVVDISMSGVSAHLPKGTLIAVGDHFYKGSFSLPGHTQTFSLDLKAHQLRDDKVVFKFHNPPAMFLVVLGKVFEPEFSAQELKREKSIESTLFARGSDGSYIKVVFAQEKLKHFEVLFINLRWSWDSVTGDRCERVSVAYEDSDFSDMMMTEVSPQPFTENVKKTFYRFLSNVNCLDPKVMEMLIKQTSK